MLNSLLPDGEIDLFKVKARALQIEILAPFLFIVFFNNILRISQVNMEKGPQIKT